MNRIILLMMICCVSVSAFAQKNAPKWMDKARKAVVKITTYDKDDQRLGTGYGFFVSETGEILSGYLLFKNAYRGVVTDFEGKEYPVTHIIGADEMYEVIRVRVEGVRKPAILPLANEPVPEGEVAFQLLYSPGKESNFKQGKITESSKFKEVYGYYQLDFPLESTLINTPLVNSAGEVFGLAQEDSSGKNEVSYAVSATYTSKLEQSSVDIFNSTYRNIGIKKAWAANVEDAAVSLFIVSGQQDAKAFLETVNDFIRTFPNAPEGYQNRASLFIHRSGDLSDNPADRQKYLDLAKADLNTAVKVSNKPEDTLYDQAKLIYSISLQENAPDSPDWSLEKALEVLAKAIAIKDQPVYRQLEGDINLVKGDFEKAYEAYMMVNNSEMATPESYYWAVKALEQMLGGNIGDMIQLLDKAIELSGTGPESGPYLLERIDKRLLLSQYDEALQDYESYYFAMNGNVNDTFYYLREQTKLKKGDFAGALEDIKEAIQMDVDNPDYYAEEASVYIRMRDYENALGSVEKALALAPDFGVCYRLRGVCYQRMERKDEACEAYHKALELEDPLAEKLIKDNCQ